MIIDDALNIARNLKYGPIPRPHEHAPCLEEAIELIQEERRTCGFMWLTGEAAEQALRCYQEATMAS